MKIKELIKVLQYIQEKYPNATFYIRCEDGWDWDVQNDLGNINFYWDSDYLKTFEEIKEKSIDNA